MHACQENFSSPFFGGKHLYQILHVYFGYSWRVKILGVLERSRLFKVRNGYSDPLSEPAGKHKQKGMLSESLEDTREFLLHSAFVLRLVCNLLSWQPQQCDAFSSPREEIAHQEER